MRNFSSKAFKTDRGIEFKGLPELKEVRIYCTRRRQLTAMGSGVKGALSLPFLDERKPSVPYRTIHWDSESGERRADRFAVFLAL